MFYGFLTDMQLFGDFMVCHTILFGHQEYHPASLWQRIDDMVRHLHGGIVARQLGWFRAAGAYSSLDEKRPAAEMRATQFMRRFIEENLPPFPDMQYLEVRFPWNRMFEAKYSIEPPFDFKAYMEERRAE